VIDPQHEEQAVLSAEVPTPIGAPATAASLLTDTEVAIVQHTQFELVWRRLRRHKFAMAGGVTLILLTIMAVFAPLISPEDYLNWNYLVSNLQPRFALPGQSDWKYIMGSDVQGHSLLMWISYGARVSLAVGLFSALLTSVIGIVLGGTAGYFGGWIDAVVMRVTDVFLTLPFLPLIILLSYYVANGNWILITVIFGLTTWPGSARLVRTEYGFAP